MRVLNVLLTINTLIYLGWFAAFAGLVGFGAGGWQGATIAIALFGVYCWACGVINKKWVWRGYMNTIAYKTFALMFVTALNIFIVFVITPPFRQFVSHALKNFGVEFDPG